MLANVSSAAWHFATAGRKTLARPVGVPWNTAALIGKRPDRRGPFRPLTVSARVALGISPPRVAPRGWRELDEKYVSEQRCCVFCVYRGGFSP
jgi:hypothetical protein